MNGDEFNKIIYDKIKEFFPKGTVYASGKDGVNNIVLFDEPVLTSQKSRYRIAYTTMIVIEDNQPILGIETVFSTSSIPPKNFLSSIPLYMITRKIIIPFKEGKEIEYNLDENMDKIRLLVVLSEQKSKAKKVQINDLNEKVSGIINLNSEYSYLNDFRICELLDMEQSISELILDDDQIKTLTTGNAAQVDKQSKTVTKELYLNETTFTENLDSYGKSFFEKLFRFVKANDLVIRWGKKGFSLNVLIENKYVSLLQGYTHKSSYKQSIFSTVGNIGRKVKNGDILIDRYVSEVIKLDGFDKLGNGFKFNINRSIDKDEYRKFEEILNEIIGEIRKAG